MCTYTGNAQTNFLPIETSASFPQESNLLFNHLMLDFDKHQSLRPIQCSGIPGICLLLKEGAWKYNYILHIKICLAFIKWQWWLHTQSKFQSIWFSLTLSIVFEGSNSWGSQQSDSKSSQIWEGINDIFSNRYGTFLTKKNLNNCFTICMLICDYHYPPKTVAEG